VYVGFSSPSKIRILLWTWGLPVPAIRFRTSSSRAFPTGVSEALDFKSPQVGMLVLVDDDDMASAEGNSEEPTRCERFEGLMEWRLVENAWPKIFVWVFVPEITNKATGKMDLVNLLVFDMLCFGYGSQPLL